ncbi:PEP-CTERM sorting domain-containing protein [Paludisphaera sp.]|uniref:PEP-CTERM sorting domain-containing protein n=1 Tax=Paludisphaera sp. TaxID=2017432 RepID=UPI00301E2DD6
MSMTKGLTRLKSAVLAASLVVGAGTSVEAAAILKYQTATAIDLSSGITGANLISFTPASGEIDVASGSVNAGLGTFVVAPPAEGSRTVYENVKFAITFLPQSLAGEPISSVSQVITGVLNGVVDNAYRSTVVATFDDPEGSLDLGSQTITLSFPKGEKLLVPPRSFGGVTTAEAQITSTATPDTPVPEPSTIALVLTTIGGLALRRRVSARRAQPAA